MPPLIDGHADPIIVPLTPEADALWCAWYESLEESDDTARLDNIGMRLLGGLSLVNGQREIDTKLVQSTIDILEYEKRVRQEIRPIDGDSPLAKQEQRIIAALKKHDAPMSERDLRRYANADYHGWKLHCDAEQSLVRGCDP